MKTKKEIAWDHQKAHELVKLSGLKNWKIAEGIGISEKTLTNILYGLQSPSVPVVKLLAQVLGCEESELTGDTEQAS